MLLIYKRNVCACRVSMKSVLCLLLIVAYVIGDPEVCTGLKALHQKSACCGGTGDATCVAAPAKHYLGTRETKSKLHEVGHLIVAAAENVIISKIQYRCPADDTVTYNDQVVTWEHNTTHYRAYGASGSWVQATSVNITTVYNAKTDTLCEMTPETNGANRRLLARHHPDHECSLYSTGPDWEAIQSSFF